MRASNYRLVVTSRLNPPWAVAAHYGVERGRYIEHLRQVGRDLDNQHSEAMNDRLEGYGPLVRLDPGSLLADVPELAALLRAAD